MPETIEVKGVEAILKKFAKLPRELEISFGQAGKKIFELLTPDLGGGSRFYVPPTEHNAPPEPYYERGVGEHWPNGTVDMTSVQMDKRFYYTPEFPNLYVGNSAPYAPDVIGPQQTRLFKEIGWQQFIAYGLTKTKEITAIMQDWANEALKKAGLT